MIDEIMIGRLADAHDEEMSRLYLGAAMYEENETTHWDEWMIDHAIDCSLEE